MKRSAPESVDEYIAAQPEAVRPKLEQVRAAVSGGATGPDDVVATVYADVDRALWPAATLSVLAQLEHLRREHRREGP